MDTMVLEPTHTVDARGKSCPLPVVITYRFMKQLAAGAVVCVMVTDRMAYRNFRAYCRQAGHDYIDSERRDDGLAIFVRKRDTRERALLARARSRAVMA